MGSEKKIISPYKIFNATSLASSAISIVTQVTGIDNVGITLSTTGVTTNTGAFVVEASIDGMTFIDLGVIPTLVLSNVDNNFIINLNQVPFVAIRVRFTPGGGTPNGVVTGYITGKGV